MSQNPYSIFKDNYRSNLPQGVTWDADTASYVYNDKRFKTIWAVEWYRRYLFATEGFTGGDIGVGDWADNGDWAANGDWSE